MKRESLTRLHYYRGVDSPDDNALADKARELGQLLLQERLTLVTAESCTGGWIGKVCTDVSGSSGWFLGGVIAYDNAVKVNQLHVPAAAIEQFGAVSEPVVRAMAEGAREGLAAGIGVAVSGVAGPDGGTPEKPVGTVWVGLAMKDRVQARCFQLPGDRDNVRRSTVSAALDWIKDEIS